MPLVCRHHPANNNIAHKSHFDDIFFFHTNYSRQCFKCTYITTTATKMNRHIYRVKPYILTHFFVDSNWLAYVMLIVLHHCAACHRPHCHSWQFAQAFVSSTFCFWRIIYCTRTIGVYVFVSVFFHSDFNFYWFNNVTQHHRTEFQTIINFSLFVFFYDSFDYHFSTISPAKRDVILRRKKNYNMFEHSSKSFTLACSIDLRFCFFFSA